MKKLLLGSCLSLSMFSMLTLGDQLTGYISDAHCGAKHDSASAANTQCIEGCMKGGSQPVLVSNGKVYKLDADSAAKAKDFAGQNVKIDGSSANGVLTISSITKAE
jgi:hypothetical protein